MPPRRLLALATDDTLTSMRWPGCANGGSSAVTITAATLRSCIVVPDGRLTPICCSIAMMLCAVNGACDDWSPVPSSPTTRP